MTDAATPVAKDELSDDALAIARIINKLPPDVAAKARALLEAVEVWGNGLISVWVTQFVKKAFPLIGGFAAPGIRNGVIAGFDELATEAASPPPPSPSPQPETT
jgi:hypothetical protein